MSIRAGLMLVVAALLTLLVMVIACQEVGLPVDTGPHPPTPIPPATAVPTPIPGNQVILRMSDKYDSIVGLADSAYQDGAEPFTEGNFAGFGSAVSNTDTIILPAVFPFGGISLGQIRGGLPSDLSQSHGHNHRAVSTSGMIWHYRRPEAPPVPVVLEIDGIDHHLLITKARLNCQLFGGIVWRIG